MKLPTRAKVKHDPEELVVCLAGHWYKNPDNGADEVVRTDEVVRGSHPSARARPLLFTTVQSTPEERKLLYNERFPIDWAKADAPKVIVPDLTRRRVALVPVVTDLGFIAAGTILDKDHGVVKANPTCFGLVPEADEAA